MAFSASVSSDTPGLPVGVMTLAEVIVGRLLKNETIAAWLREQSFSDTAYPAHPVTEPLNAMAVRELQYPKILFIFVTAEVFNCGIEVRE